MIKAFILAAGLGTRLKQLTRNKPKALVLLNKKPLLEHTILNLKSQGINDFIINIHHFPDQIINFLKEKNNFGCNIQISDEREKLLDTGGALLFAEDKLKDAEHILIHNVDIFSDIDIKEFIANHIKNNALATLAVHNSSSARKLSFNENMQLCMWKNIQTGEIKKIRNCNGKFSDFSFTGIHIINKDIFKHITETGKFSVINLYLRLAEKHKIIGNKVNYKYWFDLGKPETLKSAENIMRKT